MKGKLNWFTKIFFLLHFIILAVGYSVYLNSYIKPGEFPYFNYVSIGFPIIFGLDVVLILFWILLNWRMSIIFTLLSIGLFPVVSLSYQFFGKKSLEKPDLSIMTYNVFYMNGDNIYDFIYKNKTDIMLFQEVYGREALPLKEKYFNNYYYQHNDYIACFSKYPIIDTKIIFKPTENETGTSSYYDIVIGKDTIRLINVYLQPMKIEKNLIRETIKTEDENLIEEKTGEIDNLLVKGMNLHEGQIKKIMPYIKNSKYPIILCGDLNSTPKSFEYNQFSYHLKDSFKKVGNGNGTTFHGFKFPLRLDYLFTSKQISPVSVRIIREKHSDHYPVIGEFNLP